LTPHDSCSTTDADNSRSTVDRGTSTDASDADNPPDPVDGAYRAIELGAPIVHIGPEISTRTGHLSTKGAHFGASTRHRLLGRRPGAHSE
jgi:hypothetical protein